MFPSFCGENRLVVALGGMMGVLVWNDVVLGVMRCLRLVEGVLGRMR